MNSGPVPKAKLTQKSFSLKFCDPEGTTSSAEKKIHLLKTRQETEGEIPDGLRQLVFSDPSTLKILHLG